MVRNVYGVYLGLFATILVPMSASGAVVLFVVSSAEVAVCVFANDAAVRSVAKAFAHALKALVASAGDSRLLGPVAAAGIGSFFCSWGFSKSDSPPGYNRKS